MKKVLIPTKLDKEVAKILGNAGFEVVQNPEKAVIDLASENTDAEVIIVRSEKVTPEVMDKLPSLRLVVRAGAGFDNIDIESVYEAKSVETSVNNELDKLMMYKIDDKNGRAYFNLIINNHACCHRTLCASSRT